MWCVLGNPLRLHTIYFCRTVKSWESSKPVVVHCASGAGRTGVIIAIDIGLQSLLNKDPVIDVLRIVSALKQDRIVLIQTSEQYRFVNQVYIKLRYDKLYQMVKH